MNKTQIIIIVLAVLSVFGLYSLPRVVVSDDENEVQNFIEQTMPENGMTDHSGDIPAEVLPEVNRWKAQLMPDGEITENQAALDSLMTVFRQINKYDSAAYYAGALAERYPKVANWQKAGNAYFEAFTFAVDEPKVRLMAQNSKTFYDKVLDSGVNDLDAKNNLAMMLVGTGSPMQGVMKLREILAEDSVNLKALMSMGALSIESRQFEKAVERFEKVVENYPDHFQARYWLGVSYFETGRIEEAKEQLERVKTMDNSPMTQTAVDEYLQRIN